MRLTGFLVGLALIWLAAACSGDRRDASVTVVFTRDERPAPVRRAVDGSPTLERALTLLLAGPSEEEREAGLTSWFSDRTAGALRSVSMTPEGAVTVDLADLRQALPGASSSAGSAMLMQELTGTVFAFEEVASVTFTTEGSCDAFWNWLQRSCTVVRRGETP